MGTIRYVNISLEIFGGLLSLIIIFCLLVGENEKNRLYYCFIRCLAGNIALLLCDAAAWHFKGRTGWLDRSIVCASNFLVFVLGYVLLAFFTEYLVCYFSDRTPISDKPVKMMWGMAAVAILLVVVSQFNHMYYFIDQSNMYHRGKLFFLSQVWGIVGMVVNAGLIISHRKHMDRRGRIVLLLCIFLPAVAMLIQIFSYGVALLHMANCICILCVYMMLQVEQAQRLKQKEQEIEEKRAELMLGQIQPHFLYNSLSAIRGLCDSDPKQAKEAILEFSGFLRGNMDSLVCKGLIPFVKELQHTESYLALEKRRYGNRLTVIYAIEDRNFFLPPLTLQPIAENAVRYATTGKAEGGVLWIRTWKEKDHIIEIKDNGAGVFGESSEGGSGIHMGMENVRRRLQMMCAGTLEVRSRKGEGVSVTIRIPQGGKPEN